VKSLEKVRQYLREVDNARDREALSRLKQYLEEAENADVKELVSLYGKMRGLGVLGPSQQQLSRHLWGDVLEDLVSIVLQRAIDESDAPGFFRLGDTTVEGWRFDQVVWTTGGKPVPCCIVECKTIPYASYFASALGKSLLTNLELRPSYSRPAFMLVAGEGIWMPGNRKLTQLQRMTAGSGLSLDFRVFTVRNGTPDDDLASFKLAVARHLQAWQEEPGPR
jgi:hypothetical protein